MRVRGRLSRKRYYFSEPFNFLTRSSLEEVIVLGALGFCLGCCLLGAVLLVTSAGVFIGST